MSRTTVGKGVDHGYGSGSDVLGMRGDEGINRPSAERKDGVGGTRLTVDMYWNRQKGQVLDEQRSGSSPRDISGLAWT